MNGYDIPGCVSRRGALAALSGFCLCLFSSTGTVAQNDPLPSWNDGAAKKAITDFVARVTTPGGADFVPPEQRIATFDNDGTLWCEQPFYFQLAFAFDEAKAMAPKHPEWKSEQPFKALVREYAYDRQSQIGRLDKAWDEAKRRGWTMVDMKQDWKTVFPEKP
jgi:hypothetical protein